MEPNQFTSAARARLDAMTGRRVAIVFSAGVLYAGAFALGLMCEAVSAGELVVYSTIEPEEVQPYKAAFEADNPGITLDIVRSSAGTMTARILAEKNNPQNDAMFRIANTSLIVFGKEGLVYPYEPKGMGRVDPEFRDKVNKPALWTGTDAYTNVICYNVPESKKLGLPRPKSWQDLTKPIYKGYIVAPNPQASGTGFINMAAWISLWGEDKALQNMDKLTANVKFYMNSGSAPCRKAASGEVPIALSWDLGAAELISQGAPIEALMPEEGLGWDLEGSAIMKAAEKRGRLEDAKKLMDWMISDRAMKLHNKSFAIIAIPETAVPTSRHLGTRMDMMKRVVKYDFAWNAENRNRLIEKWTARYEGKVQK
jgi:iron(III) transport system substrate-binding protein